MKNPFKDCGPKHISFHVPPGCPSEFPISELVRAPGELSDDPPLKEFQLSEIMHMKKIRVVLNQLADLSEREKMPIIQENGQRRYGPSFDENVYPPPRGSEVFVGRLPRDFYETDLIPVLEMAGKIYEMRLMMNFSGNNRGYCFVQYSSPTEADNAVRILNNYEIKKGYLIGVTKSVDNRRLFIGRIPKDKDAIEIKTEIDSLTEGVVKVQVKKPFMNGSIEKNRGYAFVEYESHRSAAMARRKLLSGKLKMWGACFAVDWADPEPEVGHSAGVRGPLLPFFPAEFRSEYATSSNMPAQFYLPNMNYLVIAQR